MHIQGERLGEANLFFLNDPMGKLGKSCCNFKLGMIFLKYRLRNHVLLTILSHCLGIVLFSNELYLPIVK